MGGVPGHGWDDAASYVNGQAVVVAAPLSLTDL
jgi:hypothetical protein